MNYQTLLAAAAVAALAIHPAEAGEYRRPAPVKVYNQAKADAAASSDATAVNLNRNTLAASAPTTVAPSQSVHVGGDKLEAAANPGNVSVSSGSNCIIPKGANFAVVAAGGGLGFGEESKRCRDLEETIAACAIRLDALCMRMRARGQFARETVEADEREERRAARVAAGLSPDEQPEFCKTWTGNDDTRRRFCEGA